MRLSMWMLADWLKGYEPAVQIESGKRTLRNARLYSENLRNSRSTVYVSQPQPEHVLCSNGNDCLILRADDVNEIFNAVLDAFEFYNDLSADAYDMIEEGCAAADLIALYGRTFDCSVILADATFYMRELYDDGQRLRASVQDQSILENRILSPDMLLSISEKPGIRMPDTPSYTVRPPGANVAVAVTNLFSEGKHNGWLISVGSGSTISQGFLDLQDGFGEIVEKWMNACDRPDEHMERAGIFLELLERGGLVPQAEERLRTFGWHTGDPMQVYAFRPATSEYDLTYAMEHTLGLLNGYAFPFRHEGQLMYILDLYVTPADQIEPQLRQVLERFTCVAGKSPVFTDLAQLSNDCDAARMSVRFAGNAPGTIRTFEETELPYIAELLRKHSAFDLRHPAAVLLSAYDEEHDAELSATLREFLRNNCGYVATAQALHIHRSTLLYRLERITELTGIDLEDDQTRLLLQLTFLFG